MWKIIQMMMWVLLVLSFPPWWLKAAWALSLWKHRWPVSSYHSYDNLITALVTWDLLTGQKMSPNLTALCFYCCSFITPVLAVSKRLSSRWAGLPVSVTRTCCMLWRFKRMAQLAAGQTPAWTHWASRYREHVHTAACRHTSRNQTPSEKTLTIIDQVRRRQESQTLWKPNIKKLNFLNTSCK